MLTRESRMRDLLANPIGRDIITRLTQYAGVDAQLVDNPLVRSLKLSALPRLSGGVIDDALLDTLLDLFNQETDTQDPAPSFFHAWWKEAVIYQIYPRSFMDSNADGVGDIRGVIERLDYLEQLGVTAVWLTPIFDSPQDDNGYDVRDYRRIFSEFGEMEDVEALIAALHERGMRLILDLVLNHTSDEHAWFVDSLADPDGPHGDYYIWRKGDGTAPPNNWTSFFSGPAWTYYPERDAYALHLFSGKQMDLNWSEPRVRKAVCDVVSFWREKGVDGFRLDVINYISKTSLADGSETVGKILGFTGMERYFYGDQLHAYLKELRHKGLEDAFAVGETPGTGAEMNKRLTAPARGELDTVFCFDHLDVPGKNRFDDYRYDLNHLKRCFLDYEGDYAETAWPSIFIENHDNPRMVSKVEPSLSHRDELAKLLAVSLLTARGTVFLYQGQELGMANAPFQDITELRDVESLNRYAEFAAQGHPDPFGRILPGTRDHARTPMQWSGEAHAGFSTAEPWIRPGDYESCNAHDQARCRRSVLRFYTDLIALRKSDADALVYGSFEPVSPKKRDLFCYYRRGGGTVYYIEMNLTDRAQRPLPRPMNRSLALSNYEDASNMLRPYEANVFKL